MNNDFQQLIRDELDRLQTLQSMGGSNTNTVTTHWYKKENRSRIILKSRRTFVDSIVSLSKALASFLF